MNTIFISIASYRDPELEHTIKSAVENADYPNNLRFGIVSDTNKNMFFEFHKLFDNNVDSIFDYSFTCISFFISKRKFSASINSFFINALF